MNENNQTKPNSALKELLGEKLYNEFLRKSAFTTCCGEPIATLSREEMLVSLTYLINEEKEIISEQMDMIREAYKSEK